MKDASSDKDNQCVAVEQSGTVEPTKAAFQEITEGKATILFATGNQVFYNPVQQFNRDLSIAVIRQWAQDRRCELASKKPQNNKKLNSNKKPNKDQDAQAKAASDADASTSTSTSTLVPAPNPPTSRPQRKFRILEALSASGLRSLRYALEMDDIVEQVIANDMSSDAVASIRRNAEFNGLSEERLLPNQGDAKYAPYMGDLWTTLLSPGSSVMYQNIADAKRRFNVVDLDPYGSAAPFLDAAVQSVSDGGLLCVTCTDMTVLAGTYPETCYAKYGGVTVKTDFCHELALRILLHAIQTSAGRYRRNIVPILSCSIDFYVRVFVRIYDSPAETKKFMTKTSMVQQCSGCHTFYTFPLGRSDPKGNPNKFMNSQPVPVGPRCPHCEGAFHVGGPFWSGPLHDSDFVSRLLGSLQKEGASSRYGTHSRMLGFVSVISEEIQAPFYYDFGAIFSKVRSSLPKMMQFTSAILNAGYQFSLSHCLNKSIKTNAPPEFLWDVVRSWVQQSGQGQKNLPDGHPGVKILAKPVTHENISFELHPDANPKSRKDRLTRFETHKGMNWGPKARAGKRLIEEEGSNVHTERQKQQKKEEATTAAAIDNQEQR